MYQGAVKEQLIIVLFAAMSFMLLLPADGNSSSEGILKMMEFSDSHLKNGAPAGWQLLRYKGEPSFRVERIGDQFYLRMKSSGNTAFGIMKELAVDIRKYRYINWTWKALRLPQGGDVRQADQDDQVMQLYVIFSSRGVTDIMTSPTLSYIWDNEAPKNLMIQSPQKRMGYVRYLVLRNKTDAMGRWQKEKRNLYEDYKKMFKDIHAGEPQGPIQSLVLFINTHHTKSDAEGCIGEIYFSSKGE